MPTAWRSLECNFAFWFEIAVDVKATIKSDLFDWSYARSIMGDSEEQKRIGSAVSRLGPGGQSIEMGGGNVFVGTQITNKCHFQACKLRDSGSC